MDRRTRKPQAQSLQKSEGCQATPAADAQPIRLKKSPRLGTLGQIAQAWGKGRISVNSDQQVGKELANTWAHITAHQLTEPMIRAQVAIWRHRLSPRTAFAYRGCLVRLLKVVDRATGTHHADNVPKLTNPGPRTLLAKDEELENTLRVSPLWLRCLILMGRLLGLRHGEALAVTPAHINERENTITFKRKGGGTSGLPIPPDLTTMFKLAQEQDPCAPIIETLRGRPVNREMIYRAWDKAKRTANANPDLIIHDLRRTVATHLYDATKDLRAVQALLGHKHLDSTLKYIAPADSEHLRTQLLQLRRLNLHYMTPATEVKQ